MIKFIEAVEDNIIIDELEQRGYEIRKKPRNFEIEPLHSLLCDRWSLSYHSTKEKLIDLVVKELNI